MEELCEARAKIAKYTASNDLVILVLNNVALARRVTDSFHQFIVLDFWELLSEDHRKFNESYVTEDSSKVEFG